MIRTFLAMLCLVPQCATAEDAPDDEIKAWQQRRLAEFAEYAITEVAPTGEVEVKFEGTSLLNWTNPIRMSPAGAVFLWTVDGRPRMIASTYPFVDGVEQELTSLSDRHMILRKKGQVEHRFAPGLEWRVVPDAEPPVAQRTLRLTQMRRIAERFRVTGNRQENPFEARLLSKPIYRSPEKSAADVAVFAFVQGTDPEAILLVEANGDKEWKYALARMTVVPIAAKLDDKDVWDLAECWSTRWNPGMPFHTIQLEGAK